MTKIEMVEEMFAEMCAELNLEWYELYDSEKFEDFEKLVADKFGANYLESKEYSDWTNEMYWDL